MTFGGIKSVQRGTIARTDDAETSFVVTIASVDVTKTFITQRGAYHNAPLDSFDAPSIKGSYKITGANALTVTMQASTSDRTFEYELAEFY